MNNFNVIGRITQKPVLEYTRENKGVVKLNLAIRNSKDDTTFLPIKVFGKQAENIEKYCDKGTSLAIIGTIKNNNWEKDGIKHYDYTFIAQNVEFLSKSTNSTTETQTTKIEPKKEVFDNEQVFADFGDLTEFDDDIAF